MATAMFRKAGVLEFHDTEEMVKAAVAFSMQEPPRGKRIGMITNTGGPGIQAVDQAVANGLTLARWSPEGLARLKETQYAEASLGNPVDVVATGGPDHYHAAIETLLGEKETDMVLVFFVTAPFVDLDAISRRIKEATEKSDKPVVMVVETIDRWKGLIDSLRAVGLPVYEFAEDGSRALAAMSRYTDLKERPREPLPEIEEDHEAAAALIARHEGQDAYLPQAEAFALLAHYGIEVPKVKAVAGADELAAAAKEVGFPCVLKVDSPEVIHKSDEGGVTLDIGDQAALEEAFKAMADRFSGKQVAYILMEQKPTGREVIIGATDSPGLGSLVMFGLGGIFVEVMKDVVFGVAPLSRPEAREMMGLIKGYAVLEGVRGERPVDLAGLEELLVRASRLAADFSSIVEMDLNPIFAYPEGTPPAAVDVRIRIR
jgi:acetyltransferase